MLYSNYKLQKRVNFVGYRRLTLREINEIKRLKIEGFGAKEISETVGCSMATVFKHAKEVVGGLACYKCKNAHNDVDAEYCKKCGSKLKTDNQILADEILRVRGDFMRFVPENSQKDVDTILLKAAGMIENI